MMPSTTILALDGVFDTGLAAIQDTLATARDLAPPGSNDAWKAQVFSIRRVAHTAHGLAIPTMQAEARSNPEFVFVPALPSGAYGVIRLISAAHGTTRSISARNSRFRVRLVVRFRPRSACSMAQILQRLSSPSTSRADLCRPFLGEFLDANLLDNYQCLDCAT
ncbi:hypothetical protein ASF43_06440 [Pseudorhodoferax sp. Leaf267]|nr:hypothetical protein ASF43_06440 [Pseudorhodoferax sp. Leaf267]